MFAAIGAALKAAWPVISKILPMVASSMLGGKKEDGAAQSQVPQQLLQQQQQGQSLFNSPSQFAQPQRQNYGTMISEMLRKQRGF